MRINYQTLSGGKDNYRAPKAKELHFEPKLIICQSDDQLETYEEDEDEFRF